MTTKIPVELSSTPSIVDGGNATAITIDSSENVTFASSIDVAGTVTSDGLTVEPTTAVGLTYGADGTNSFINFEANSVVASVQLYAGQSSGGYFAIGTKDSGGTLAQRMIVTSTGVGIGTNPDKLLHLAASSGATLRLESTTTGATTGDIFGAIEFETQDSNSAGVKGKIDSYSEGGVGNAALRFFTGNTTELGERLRIDSAGLVSMTHEAGGHTGGLSIINSQAGGYGSALTFQSERSDDNSIVSAAQIRTQGQDSWNSAASADSNLFFATALNGSLTDKMVIKHDGAVGIGTNSPATILHAKASGDAELRLEAGANQDARVRFGDATDNDLGYIGFNRNAGYMNFSINNTQGEHMRIDSAGNLLVGTTSPINSTHVISKNNSNNNIIIFENKGTSTPFGVQVRFTGEETTRSDRYSYSSYHGTGSLALRFGVQTDGGISNFSANNTNLSDIREKKNIEDADNTWSDVKQWSIRKYHYNTEEDESPKKIGVIAQEIEELDSNLIKSSFIDEQQNTERLYVKEQQMTWMAIKALQEAMIKIESLEARVTELEG